MSAPHDDRNTMASKAKCRRMRRQKDGCLLLVLNKIQLFVDKTIDFLRDLSCEKMLKFRRKVLLQLCKFNQTFIISQIFSLFGIRCSFFCIYL